MIKDGNYKYLVDNESYNLFVTDMDQINIFWHFNQDILYQKPTFSEADTKNNFLKHNGNTSVTPTLVSKSRIRHPYIPT